MEDDAVDAQLAGMTRLARYETCAETANQLIGILLGQERQAADDSERSELRQQRRDVRRRMRQCAPGSPAEVEALITEWSPQVRAALDHQRR